MSDVYMRQPPGFVDGTNFVCKLRKCLYGLETGTSSVVRHAQRMFG